MSDPELNERWEQVNGEWKSRKKNYSLKILREIKRSHRTTDNILREMAETDPLLHFFGIDQPELLERYRNAEPGAAKDNALAEYLKRREDFLRESPARSVLQSE